MLTCYDVQYSIIRMHHLVDFTYREIEPAHCKNLKSPAILFAHSALAFVVDSVPVKSVLPVPFILYYLAGSS
jgi:hypothetical protein